MSLTMFLLCVFGFFCLALVVILLKHEHDLDLMADDISRLSQRRDAHCGTPWPACGARERTNDFPKELRY